MTYRKQGCQTCENLSEELGNNNVEADDNIDGQVDKIAALLKPEYKDLL